MKKENLKYSKLGTKSAKMKVLMRQEMDWIKNTEGERVYQNLQGKWEPAVWKSGMKHVTGETIHSYIKFKNGVVVHKDCYKCRKRRKNI